MYILQGKTHSIHHTSLLPYHAEATLLIQDALHKAPRYERSTTYRIFRTIIARAFFFSTQHNNNNRKIKHKKDLNTKTTYSLTYKLLKRPSARALSCICFVYVFNVYVYYCIKYTIYSNVMCAYLHEIP